MAYRFLIKKRFQNRVRKVYAYLLEDWDVPTADSFLLKLDRKIDAIVKNPLLGNPSSAYKNLRSLSVTGHNRLFYRIEKDTIVFIMLSDTRRRRYKR